MRTIKKGVQPIQLAQYKATPYASYDGSPINVKDAIRDALLKDQGHLCAYCMQRITKDKMKIEHWRSQSNSPNLQLDYRNMLGCCQGYEAPLDNKQHCDTKKADKTISYNPSDPAHHASMCIRYLGDGVIQSGDKQFNEEIDSILNLNISRLKRNRKSALISVKDILAKKDGTRSRSEIQKLIAKLHNANVNGFLNEYCGVSIYYLEKKLARIS